MAFRLAQSSAAVRRTILPDESAVEVTLYHDVFCAWSYIADQRLQALQDEYGAEVRFSWRPFPLRPEAIAADKRERGLFARHFRRAAREPEGKGVVPDLWTGNDPPSSSLPPLIALEAARRESPEKQRELLLSMRRAVFLRGVNVARLDVQLELAESVGLDTASLLLRLEHPSASLAVAESVREAEAMGIHGVPALVIGDEWLMQGCREVSEYREVINKYLREKSGGAPLHVVH
jgi:predicted DsbA family dithiol-disulfide isomerase